MTKIMTREISKKNTENRFYLKNNNHACVFQDNVIIINEKHDIYYQLDAKLARKIFYCELDLLPGDECYHVDMSSLRKQVEHLLINEIATTNKQEGKPLRQCHVQKPNSPFEQLFIEDFPEFSINHVVAVLWAAARAQFYLKIMGVHKTLDNLRKIKSNHMKSTYSKDPLYLARIYHQVRPFIPKDRTCLFDSVTFVYFCKNYGAHPELVFGVIDDPFQAHCWVQDNGTILNDVPQFIGQFTPILAV